MARYVALLRGINVSGQKLIKMEELRKHFEIPGFSNISTYIQSGNVLFDTTQRKPDLVRKKIEELLETKLGYTVPVVVRSLADLNAVVSANPFPGQEEGGKARLYVSFLSDAPAAKTAAVVEACSNDLEQLKIVGREAYLLTASYGTTKFPNTFIEKKLGLQATARNWNTVNKLIELLSQ